MSKITFLEFVEGPTNGKKFYRPDEILTRPQWKAITELPEFEQISGHDRSIIMVMPDENYANLFIVHSTGNLQSSLKVHVEPRGKVYSAEIVPFRKSGSQ